MLQSPDLLNLAATTNPDAARLGDIAHVAAKVKNWKPVISRAEVEGIAPILYAHLESANYDLEPGTLQQLTALSIRHRHATPTRTREFAQISTTLADAGIESAALKGIALANLIYPEPYLRPMRDIDFLVHPEQAEHAASVLKGLGYRFQQDHPSRFMRHHHHLPNADKLVDGLKVSVEIHTNAISGDAPDRIQMHSLTEPLQKVKSEHGNFFTLGHIDMLNQLCRHALEPGHRIRLISVMDILGYFAYFDDDIDWPRLGQLFPYLPNFIGLLHFVCPLPDSLERFLPKSDAPDRSGFLIPTVGEAFGSSRSKLQALACLNHPPEWWFQSYYGVGPGARKRPGAVLEHRLRVLGWISRRLFAAGFGRQ